MMRTFCVQALGCKVNQYEAEQIAAVLRQAGLQQVADPPAAQVRVVHTCSVTVQAAAKSRQAARRVTRLPVLAGGAAPGTPGASGGHAPTQAPACHTVITGCWATSHPDEALSIPGVDAVLTNGDDLAPRLRELLDRWHAQSDSTTATSAEFDASSAGFRSLPLLTDRRSGHQRALLKIQDGCDAHCTYCIIPRLRPILWSKPIDDCVAEAQRLVDAGHVEIVLTGIFLGAYGHDTAIRKRQRAPAASMGLARLIESLCNRVGGLRRLRLSSLEPCDMTPELIAVLRSHRQVVPHFHLPLQSGSDAILRRMNRQYRRADFLRMIERVHGGFDRPALTTDIIVGFPGETDADFEQTLRIVDRARFIQIHAFHFSPRPGTAAARWTRDFVPAPVVRRRIRVLQERARQHGEAFRREFIARTVEVLVEHVEHPTIRHGRCERYFDVCFEDASARAGDAVPVRIDSVAGERTYGSRVHTAASPHPCAMD